MNTEIAKFWIDNGNMETFEDAFAQRSLLLQNNFLSLELILWNIWMFFSSESEGSNVRFLDRKCSDKSIKAS